MTSPDIPPYLDLTLDDRDPQDLVDLALADLAAKTGGAITAFPEGSYEAMLLEALALTDAEVIFAINRLPLTIYLLVLEVLFQFARDYGAPSYANLSITVTDATGRLIPAGTVISMPLAGGDVVTFTVDADVVIPAGQVVGAGTATAELAGANGNGFPVGTVISLLSPLSFVDTIALTGPTGGGRDPETDLAFATRGQAFIGTLTVVLANPLQAQLFALAQPGVFRALAINGYDPGSGHAPGVDGGHVTVAVLDAGGLNLTAPAKAALLAALTLKASADLTFHLIDPTITAVTVTATVQVAAGYDPAGVHAAVVLALSQYLSPLTWQWGAVVRRNDLIALIEDVPGVAYLDAGHPTAPAGDVALGGYAPLAQFNAGASVITMTGP